jgi:hypoxanthine phosphoribosyltransferase
MLEEPGDRRRPNLPVLVGEAELGKRVAELAAAITRDHSEDDLLVVVAIMKGALVFLADLVRHLAMPLEIELVNARSYVGADREPEVDIISDVAALPVAGRRVLLVDCILDSGHTLAALRRQIAARSPASLKTCVLLSKDRPRDVVIEPDYIGLEIPDVFVVGYGLDYRNRWRHLPYVAELTPAWTSRGDA